MNASEYTYLVIEDDRSIWKNIEQRMKRYLQWRAVGFVDEVEEALAVIDKARPQLIFSDWSIRGGNAYQILTKNF